MSPGAPGPESCTEKIFPLGPTQQLGMFFCSKPKTFENWAVLSDEQMSNKVRVEHQPENLWTSKNLKKLFEGSEEYVFFQITFEQVVFNRLFFRICHPPKIGETISPIVTSIFFCHQLVGCTGINCILVFFYSFPYQVICSYEIHPLYIIHIP